MGNNILLSSSLLFTTDLDCLITNPIFFTLRASLETLFSILCLDNVEVTFLLSEFLCVFNRGS